MAIVQADRHFWQFNPAFFDSVSSNTFDPQYWQSQGRITGKESGRGTTWFLKHGASELVLRHYLRGGLIGKINRDHYLYTGLKTSRSMHEFNILMALIDLDLPVPKPAAAQVVRQGIVYKADLIIERIPQARDLISLLESPQPSPFFAAIGAMVAQFHRAGVYHADLNIKNILCDGKGKFWLIDFDRAKLNVPAGAQQARSLKRLQRSFIKEKGRHGIAFQDSDWKTLEASYRNKL
ncbi:MAG: 3-deoxy-D-manno-octulosonic acid kinase [Oleiphilus sp.]|nr:MAG: 3-deoxy-D-manno-octulosonic acid kinase [Oleiphilus sp.]